MINGFSKNIIRTDVQRLVNQIWKLLPMKENDENWEVQLSSVLVELYGLHRVFGDQLNFLILITKLEGLKDVDNFTIYRATVFSAISLLTLLAKDLDE